MQTLYIIGDQGDDPASLDDVELREEEFLFVEDDNGGGKGEGEYTGRDGILRKHWRKFTSSLGTRGRPITPNKGQRTKLSPRNRRDRQLLRVVEVMEELHRKNLIHIFFVLPDPTKYSVNKVEELISRVSDRVPAHFLFASTSSTENTRGGGTPRHQYCATRNSVYFENEPSSPLFFADYLRCFLSNQFLPNSQGNKNNERTPTPFGRKNITQEEFIANFSTNNNASLPVFLFDFLGDTLQGGFCTTNLYNTAKRFPFVGYIMVDGKSHFKEKKFKDAQNCLNLSFSSEYQISLELEKQRKNFEICKAQLVEHHTGGTPNPGVAIGEGPTKRCFSSTTNHDHDGCAVEECILRHSCVNKKVEGTTHQIIYTPGGLKNCPWHIFLPVLMTPYRLYSILSNVLSSSSQKVIFINEGLTASDFVLALWK